MFQLDADLQVYLHRNAVDFRLGINGLVALVEQSMQLDPFARAVYAFHNRRRNRIKLLLWDRNGFWMQPGRGQEYPQAFLAGYHGMLMTDGYSAWRTLEGVTHFGCLAHSRRMFE